MQTSTDFKPRRTSAFMQSVSVLLTVLVFCYVSLRPFVAAAQTVTGRVALPAHSSEVPSYEPPAEELYAQGLERLRELVRQALSHKGKERVQAVREQLQALEQLDDDVDSSFAGVSRHLVERELPPELMARHQAAEETFRQKRAELKKLTRALAAATDEAGGAARVGELAAFLASQPGKRHKKLDVKKLPWRSPAVTQHAPAKTAKGFTLTAGDAAALRVSANAPGPMALEGGSSPELSETEDIQLTAAIQSLATQLSHDPVLIYNWVRNNIHYVPSFGSIQGSDATLSKRRGNAFDISSLLIALYRASGIPARYVYGTIEVPADAAMNWVGNVSTPQAAQQLWGQAGVPNMGLINNGRVTHIQLEHMWVEAWVDFEPSRGAKHQQGDTWVALDASYKQYTANPGIAAQVNVPVDTAAITAAVLAGATVNETEGFIQNANAEPMNQATLDYTASMRAAVTNVDSTPTGAEAFGTRSIVAVEATTLAAALPYRTVAIGARYAGLPTSLRHKFRYQIYTSDLDVASGTPSLAFQESLPRLAGKQLALRYAPATQADADLIVSYMPKRHADGTEPAPTEYASVRFPAYLIKLRPELLVDGEVRASGEPVTMGTTLSASGAFTEFDLRSGWDETADKLTAGQATAIGLNLQGIAGAQLTNLEARIRDVKARYEAGNTAGMNGGALAGDLLAATIWSYLASVDSFALGSQWQSGMIDLPGLSFGLAHVDLAVTYAFGVARSARPDGVVLDVGHLRNVRWSKDNNADTWRHYNRHAGSYASALEHWIPEQMFVTAQMPGEAVSAVKLLAKAAAEGQRIYTLTQANIATALPHLSLSAETLADIRAAVAAGKEVTVHQRPVTINGWSGAGYTVIDPLTGAGGYIIEGGANGGKLLAALGGILAGALVGLLATFILWYFLFWVAIILLVVLTVLVTLALVWLSEKMNDQAMFECFMGGFSFGLGLTFKGFKQAALNYLLGFALYVTVAGSAGRQCLPELPDF